MRRLRPGDIAVIDHVDLDRDSALALLGCGVAAVVNAAPSISGRYPNLGPEVLVGAGIPLVDGVGPEIFALLDEGDAVRIHEGVVYVGERAVVTGTPQSVETVALAAEAAHRGLAVQLEAFAANTVEFLRREHDLLLDGAGVPELATPVEGRPAVVVVPGQQHRAQLQRLRGYLREHRPVLVGVEEGADTLLSVGLRPDLVVGDLETVSDAALTSGAELVLRTDRDGRAPGWGRLEELGRSAVAFPAEVTSEDLALLLLHGRAAELIVTVGTHTSLVEFLDRGRAGMASTFLTRLRVGSRLVDAAAVARLHRSRIGLGPLLVLVFAALLAMGLALALSPSGPPGLDGLRAAWDNLVVWLRGFR